MTTADVAAPASAIGAVRGRSRELLTESTADLGLAAAVFVWIGLVLLLDRGAGHLQQAALGLATWAFLLAALRRESTLVRAQVGIVVVFATAVEYTFSPLLEVYVYRLDNVPAFVPPGHGLVYLCALAFGRTRLVAAAMRPLLAVTVAAGGGYAGWGLLGSERLDVLGAFWYACLLGFLLWGPSRGLYVGAFLIVTYLEVLGTWLGTWEWQAYDPTGLVAIGNPPSGAAGGYGWFDVAALLAAPALLRRTGHFARAARTSSCSSPLVETALPPAGPGVPSSAVKRPPASATIRDSAARSQRETSGSAATSTAPSATSTWDQKSP